MWKRFTALAALGLRPVRLRSRGRIRCQMSCRDAQALVVSHGAIVLGTGPNRYERYVRDQSFCPIGMRTQSIWDQRLTLPHPHRVPLPGPPSRAAPAIVSMIHA